MCVACEYVRRVFMSNANNVYSVSLEGELRVARAMMNRFNTRFILRAQRMF